MKAKWETANYSGRCNIIGCKRPVKHRLFSQDEMQGDSDCFLSLCNGHRRYKVTDSPARANAIYQKDRQNSPEKMTKMQAEELYKITITD